MEAGEPEERAAEEKEVVEKAGERNAERTGSDAMESSADVAVVVVVELLKVERRWRGEGDLGRGDAGEAILCEPLLTALLGRKCSSLRFLFLERRRGEILSTLGDYCTCLVDLSFSKPCITTKIYTTLTYEK